MEKKLRELDALLEKNLITQEEYLVLRKKVIEDFDLNQISDNSLTKNKEKRERNLLKHFKNLNWKRIFMFFTMIILINTVYFVVLINLNDGIESSEERKNRYYDYMISSSDWTCDYSGECFASINGYYIRFDRGTSGVNSNGQFRLYFSYPESLCDGYHIILNLSDINEYSMYSERYYDAPSIGYGECGVGGFSYFGISESDNVLNSISDILGVDELLQIVNEVEVNSK